MNAHPSAQQPRLAGRPARRRKLVSLTPLIDVVFILLVFFMLASSFLDWRAIDLDTPADASAAGTLEGALLVEVRATGLRVGGEAVAADALARRVGARLEAVPDTRVLVRPAPGVELQRVVSVLDDLAAMEPEGLSLIRSNGP